MKKARQEGIDKHKERKKVTQKGKKDSSYPIPISKMWVKRLRAVTSFNNLALCGQALMMQRKGWSRIQL